MLGEKSLDYTISLNNIGFAYSGLGENEKAKESYSAAAEICLKMFGEKHPQYATSLNNLSLAYMDGGDKEKALCYLSEVEALDNNHQGIQQFRTFIDADL